MTDLDKEIEEKIYDILKKYHKDEDYNLNYLITDNVVTFFLSINEGNLVTMEDLYKISGILNAKIKDMVLVNQEYRFSFEMEKQNLGHLISRILLFYQNLFLMQNFFMINSSNNKNYLFFSLSVQIIQTFYHGFSYSIFSLQIA